MILFFAACAIEDPTACFESAGEEISKTIKLDDFSRVIVREGIELEVQQGLENSLTIVHNENFMDDISIKIVEDRLIMENDSECKFFNGYRSAKAFLTATNITEIRNASQFTVTSKDTLRFDAFTIISEDFLEKEVNVGDFDIVVNNQILRIITNDVSNFFVSGKTQSFDINFASGQGKLIADELRAQTILLFHRGTNDLFVYPVQEIKGEIRGTGNVISGNRPPTIDVGEFYTGKLIFRD
ncbi:MAG: head GIN domain-containing protein [Flavobacteriaceae bacterium]|nr:head GIN domain-containing protein [Flavobacteriaceae bacterium]